VGGYGVSSVAVPALSPAQTPDITRQHHIRWLDRGEGRSRKVRTAVLAARNQKAGLGKSKTE